MRARRALATVGTVASDSARRFDERRISGAIAALAAAVVGVMSMADLDEVYLRDVAVVAATIVSYLVFGAAARAVRHGSRLRSPCVAVILLNVPDLRTEGAMFFVVLGLGFAALNEPRRRVVLACGLIAVAVPGVSWPSLAGPTGVGSTGSWESGSVGVSASSATASATLETNSPARGLGSPIRPRLPSGNGSLATSTTSLDTPSRS